MIGALHPYRAPPPAELDWGDGIPFSQRHGDRYYSRPGPDETRHVFLNGCDLPDRWRQQQRFTILETGFGAGLNFLTTWAQWRATRAAASTLHYVSIEAFPMPVEDQRRAVSAWPELASLQDELMARVPPATGGHHRRWLTDGVCLTLVYDLIEHALPQLEMAADAIFLDGFAPSRNADMWSDAVIDALPARCAPDARLATFTVAGRVRRRLESAGFSIDKRPGLPGKREVLQARFRGPRPPSQLPPWFRQRTFDRRSSFAIVGAGIAGAAVALALHRRGLDADIVTEPEPRAASLNPAAALLPRLPATPVHTGRIALSSALHASDEYARIDAFCARPALALALNAREADRQRRLEQNWQLPAAVAERVNATQAKALAGVDLPAGGLAFHAGGALSTARILGPWLAPHEIQQRPFEPADLAREPAAGCTILCCGMDLARPAWPFHLPLTGRRGQITVLDSEQRLHAAVLYGGLLLPLDDGRWQCGATFDHLPVTEWQRVQHRAVTDDARNIGALTAALPALADMPERVTDGRASMRAHCPDRLPAVGMPAPPGPFATAFAALRHGKRWSAFPPAPPHAQNVAVVGGLGSHGYAFAPLLAELLVSQLLGEPWPLERDLALAVHPNRFLVRRLQAGDSKVPS